MSFKKAVRKGVTEAQLKKRIEGKVGGVNWGKTGEKAGHRSDAFGRYPYDTHKSRGRDYGIIRPLMPNFFADDHYVPTSHKTSDTELSSGLKEGLKHSMKAASEGQRSKMAESVTRQRKRERKSVGQYSDKELAAVRKNRSAMELRYQRKQKRPFKQKPAMRKQRLKTILRDI